jgi:hypothetical protein
MSRRSLQRFCDNDLHKIKLHAQETNSKDRGALTATFARLDAGGKNRDAMAQMAQPRFAIRPILRTPRPRNHRIEDHAHQHARSACRIGNFDQAAPLLLDKPIRQQLL